MLSKAGKLTFVEGNAGPPYLTQAEERREKAKHRKDRAAKLVPRQGPKTNVRPAGAHVNHKSQAAEKHRRSLDEIIEEEGM
jgi:hypothetical protein